MVGKDDRHQGGAAERRTFPARAQKKSKLPHRGKSEDVLKWTAPAQTEALPIPFKKRAGPKEIPRQAKRSFSSGEGLKILVLTN